MIKKLLFLLLVSWSCRLYAQTIKTDVLVIGNGPSAMSAAIQSARSKIKTVLVAEKSKIPIDKENLIIEENLNTPSGIWGEFRNHVKDFYKTTPGFDTTLDKPLRLTKSDGEAILKKMTDTTKKLAAEWDATFLAIQKSGNEWEVKVLKDGKTEVFKAKVVVDATETGVVAQAVRAKIANKISIRQALFDPYSFRTAIAAGETRPAMRPEGVLAHDYWHIPLRAIVPSGVENLLVTQVILPLQKDSFNLPAELQLGQGAGATAAYCVFFKTTTAHLNVRVIQGELLDFKAYLVTYIDIAPGDHDWRQIQQIAATGLLKGGPFFYPDQPVLTDEIKPALTEIYARAFLWFNREKPGEKFTISNTLSFISDYTLTDPAILKATIQKAWKTQFKFKSDFDLNMPVTRREFAVLANKYLNPFARTINLDGRLVN